MKQCKCGETDITKFGKDAKRHDGLRVICKKCHNEANAKLREANRDKYRATNLAYARSEHGRKLQRANSLRRKFWPHMTNDQAVAEYDRLLAEQNNSCALCGRHQSTMRQAFDVDHCHDTSIVRGLLCNNCNRVVVQDKTVEKVKKLYEYFKKYHTI